MRSRFYLKDCERRGRVLCSARPLKKGLSVLRFAGQKTNLASVHSLQIGPYTYLSPSSGFDDFIVHSCAPNCQVVIVDADEGMIWLVALRDIERDEEISFNYNTTEFDLCAHGADFDCACGAANCLGKIQGYRYLNRAQREALGDQVARHLETLGRIL